MSLELINTAYAFSFYDSLYHAGKPDGEMNVNELIECIKYGYLKDDIEHLRKLEGQDYKDFKIKLPGVTTSGIFDLRNDSALVAHSGLIQVDIDHVAHYSALFKKLCKDPFVYVCFRSPGGKGIKAIVKIIPSNESHANQFRALSTYFRTKYKIEIDQNCKNVSRCMLLSYDPDIYCNPFADLFEKSEMPEIRPAIKFVKSNTVNQLLAPIDADSAMLERILSEVKSTGADLTASYQDWIKIGFALCSSFNENGRAAFHAFSVNHKDYDIKQTDTLYSQLLKRNDGRVKLASLVYLAKRHGLNVSKNR
jgi:hypothetical protein